uniref:D-isomer specific 2-hydroxyacid dehydrogenase NAD-binding domain-containing protein n=1 Tax=Lactuca sativa TaxID=4236 RepID=A0A9R1W831_LACSA|nr:hypothetical protein LSAT_V11C300131730 [Lactuca sativa]
MDSELENQIGVTFEEDLDKMLPKCDIIVVNTLLTEKKVSAIMDTQAVVDGCNSGHIGGYSGDVWYPQPTPKDHPWRYMLNQAMTSHISRTTINAQLRYAAGVKDMLDNYFKGEEFHPNITL